MSWNSFLNEDKKHEQPLAGSIKEHKWFTGHSFHVKKDIFENDLPSLGSCGSPGPALLPEDTQRFWVLFVNQGTITYLIIPSEIFSDFHLCFMFEAHKNAFHLLSSYDVI